MDFKKKILEIQEVTNQYENVKIIAATNIIQPLPFSFGLPLLSKTRAHNSIMPPIIINHIFFPPKLKNINFYHRIVTNCYIFIVTNCYNKVKRKRR